MKEMSARRYALMVKGLLCLDLGPVESLSKSDPSCRDKEFKGFGCTLEELTQKDFSQAHVPSKGEGPRRSRRPRPHRPERTFSASKSLNLFKSL